MSAMRLGKPASPILFDATRLNGSFVGAGINGTFGGAKATIGNVPLLLSDGSGKWLIHNNDLTVDSGLTVSDRTDQPRFYPLKSDDVHFMLAGDGSGATGACIIRLAGRSRHERDDASTGFRRRRPRPPRRARIHLRPEPAARGDHAADRGRDRAGPWHDQRARARIDWNSAGKVTSTGDFSTANIDLAAPFGPVEGLSGDDSFQRPARTNDTSGAGGQRPGRSIPASSSKTASSTTSCFPTS